MFFTLFLERDVIQHFGTFFSEQYVDLYGKGQVSLCNTENLPRAQQTAGPS